jgi:hypothetical protein
VGLSSQNPKPQQKPFSHAPRSLDSARESRCFLRVLTRTSAGLERVRSLQALTPPVGRRKRLQHTIAPSVPSWQPLPACPIASMLPNFPASPDRVKTPLQRPHACVCTIDSMPWRPQPAYATLRRPSAAGPDLDSCFDPEIGLSF